MPFTGEIISLWGIRNPFSMLSHTAGALLAVCGLVLLLRRAAVYRLVWRARLGFCVYAGSLIVSFTASALFHFFVWSPEELVFFKKVDHAAIFLLIASTCTVLLNAQRTARRTERMAACWVVAVAALVLKMIVWPMSLWTSASIYLVVGWTAAASVLTAMRDLDWDDLRLLIYGMVIFSLAAFIFATEQPVIWPGVVEGHELFHVMALAGAATHFVFVYEYCARPAALRRSARLSTNEAISLAADPQGS